MELFRISLETYAKKLTASGRPNRWNYAGQNVIYVGSSRSLSTLEMIVHKRSVKPTSKYKIMVISVSDEDSLVKQIKINELPSNWRKMVAYSKLQEMGSKWYESKESLLLKIPSAVIPAEFNYIINTEHPDFRRCVKLVRTEDYFWDSRLI